MENTNLIGNPVMIHYTQLNRHSCRPRLHGTGRIWDRVEIRSFSPVYTRIRPVRGSQIRPVPWFSCKQKGERDEFQSGSKFVRYRVNGVNGVSNHPPGIMKQLPIHP